MTRWLSPTPEALSTSARAFVLLTLGGLSLYERDSTAVVALLVIGAVWILVHSALALRLPGAVVVALEGALVAGVCGAVVHDTLLPLPALAVLPFVAGLHRGARGVTEALVVQSVVVVGVTLAVGGPFDASEGVELTTWVVLGLGVGMMATFVRSDGDADAEGEAPYRDARHLIGQLLVLSDDLRGGLDPVAIGHRLLVRTRDVIPTTRLALHVPAGDGLIVLAGKPASGRAAADREEDAAALAAAVWDDGVARVQGFDFAFRVATDKGMVGVITGSVSERVDPDPFELHRTLRDLLGRLQPLALQLDAALLFAEVRDAATLEERRRLGREMHDGVAQDIASMGYMVDMMLEAPSSPEQQADLELLRATMTRVLSEVRRSVQTLRADVDTSPSLGAAIGDLARNLTDVSGVPIRVRIEEGTTRLWPSVEAELVRITQEALQNAVRHARADVVEVSCRVTPPGYDITVRDDGLGIRSIRPDSHGLTIMRERAALIGAELDIRDAPGGGTVVSVRHRSPTEDETTGDPDADHRVPARTAPADTARD
ncbi:sensor histidine kinase [Nocardioides sp. CFH 31398]|uniref:sensor histidine kinase n=1 Tax=Nocardioides sp. CFH 31398 TaxID=2919579 RepID=UPI001F057746|nr:sensor histidine kinase [Nocardioides sp. CFH 31398]MCH1868221.1 sensor histidine kinase [Nocardioides sp. CFH 31398]